MGRLNQARKPKHSAPEAETPRALGFRMPAEWEPHAATWLTWPSSEDWPGKLDAVRWVYCELVRAITQSELARVIVQSRAAERGVLRRLSRAGVNSERVEFFVAPTDRSWARDNLPTFVVDTGRRALGAVKWRFNGWARYPDHELDDRAGDAVAESRGRPLWRPLVNTTGRRPRRFVLEGGAIDVDGQGTLLTTKRCLLGAPFQRNPGATQAEVERALREHLGVDTIVWLDDGIAGDDTSGHIDDFARFVAPGRVVIAAEQNKRDPNYEPLRRARKQLAAARDAAGRKLEVIELPMPAPVVFDGERLPASYANFYLTNDSVLVPTFCDANDRVALSILAELFPERTVRGLHATDWVVGLGTLHCSTQQEPLVTP